MKRIPSLGKKITLGYLGYYTLAILVGGIAFFTYLEMNYISSKVRAGGRVAEFFDTTLEIRRFEKNYFLYHQKSDLDETMRNVEAAQRALTLRREDFAPLAPPEMLQELEGTLDAYRKTLAGLATAPSSSEQREDRLRKLGKALVETAENLAKTERHLLQQALDRSRTIFLISISILGGLMIALGYTLSRLVVRPLKHMENCVTALAEGQKEKLHIASEDREIVSISNAFNHMLDELALRQRSLLRAEKLASMGTMLSGVAHELNNPLSNISTSCQILEEEFAHGDRAHQRELIAQIDEQTRRAARIVRTLLDFARDREVRKECFLLLPLVEETLSLLHCQRRAEAGIFVDISADLILPGDRSRIQQALLNLVKNALDACDGPGRIVIRARKTQQSDSVRAHDGELVILNKCPNGRAVVEIQITDQGTGIPGEFLPRIFDPFFTTKEVGQGSGLGLFVVHQIIEEHGGCIRINSHLGKGTKITLLLPIDSLDTQSP
jgi:signal transduction histidine kinase